MKKLTILFFCVVHCSLNADFIINQHNCQLARQNTKTGLICKYEGAGIFKPDRIITGVDYIEFPNFHQGTIDCDGTLLPDLKSVSVRETSLVTSIICANIKAAPGVLVTVRQYKCQETTSPDHTLVLSTIPVSPPSTRLASATTKHNPTNTIPRNVQSSQRQTKQTPVPPSAPTVDDFPTTQLIIASLSVSGLLAVISLIICAVKVIRKCKKKTTLKDVESIEIFNMHNYTSKSD